MTGHIDLRQIAVADSETTGVDVYNDRIVTFFVGVMDAATGTITEKWSWLINPGVPIPVEASNVHGITDDIVELDGAEPAQAIFEITQRIDILNKRGLPFAITNAPFDLTILAAEMNRYWPGAREVVPDLVLDSYVLDKQVNPFVRGKGGYQLVNACQRWGVPVLENAHDAEADCTMAGQLVLKILQHPKIVPFTNDRTAFMEKSRKSKFAQMKSLQEYFIKQKIMTEHEAHTSVLVSWPIHPLPWNKET